MPTDRAERDEEPADEPLANVSRRPVLIPSRRAARRRARRRGDASCRSAASSRSRRSCILITFTVLFPIVWIFSMSIDPRGLFRPDGLNLIPPGRHARRLRRR